MLTCCLFFSSPFLLEQEAFIVQMKVRWERNYGQGEVPFSILEAEVLNIHCPATCAFILMTAVLHPD